MQTVIDKYTNAVKSNALYDQVGMVKECIGMLIRSSGPNACVGDYCKVIPKYGSTATMAEVVGISSGELLLLPVGNVNGIYSGSLVYKNNHRRKIDVGDQLLGRVVDAFAQPIDGLGSINATTKYDTYREPVDPNEREAISETYHTGIKVIDGLLTIGKGQRIGIFAGSGVGKSTLLKLISESDDSDVHVMAMVGERGREVEEFCRHINESGLMGKYVIVVATSDQPAMVRKQAVYTATTIAEYFKDQNKNVLLTIDSLTRVASAQRDIGLAVGEPPTVRGYTPSVFAMMPPLLERSGNFKNKGSITAFYSVLMEGDDATDPLVDNVRSILDGHVILSRELNRKGHYPPIDVLDSKSRLSNVLQSVEQRGKVSEIANILSCYANNREMIEMGVYESGSSKEVDRALKLMPIIDSFVAQTESETMSPEQIYNELMEIDVYG